MTQTTDTPIREGSLEAPTRHPIDWREAGYYDEASLFAELERVFDICHGCRRCFNLCNAFPSLFDLIDESDTMELDGVDKRRYWSVVDHCYLCDMCYMTKCPYVPPHEWNVDFPHLMLRAKAVKNKQGKIRARDKLLTSTDSVGKLAAIPIVVNVVNAANRARPSRKILEKVLGVHADARLPAYHANTMRRRLRGHRSALAEPVEVAGPTQGKVVLFATCYGNYNDPRIGEDLVAVFEHNGIEVRIVERERCCGMPKLELGDFEAVAKAKQTNIPELVRWVDDGWDIVAPIPSCVLMFKQELPLMYPEDAAVQRVRGAIYDPFEYLVLRHKHGKLNSAFSKSLGRVAYHVACHQRVQNIGLKTRDILSLVPETTVEAIERCSGHDGTYAVKREYHEISMKIARPVVNKVKQAKADHYTSDCAMAAEQIANRLDDGSFPEHPMTLLKIAYGL